MDKLQFSTALADIWKTASEPISALMKPCPELAKDENSRERLAEVLYNLAEASGYFHTHTALYAETPERYGISQVFRIKATEWESAKSGEVILKAAGRKGDVARE